MEIVGKLLASLIRLLQIMNGDMLPTPRTSFSAVQLQRVESMLELTANGMTRTMKNRKKLSARIYLPLIR